MPVQILPLDFSGGVNLQRDPRRVLPNQVVKAKNLFPTRSGMLATRGVAQFYEHLSAATPTAIGVPTNLVFAPTGNIELVYTATNVDRTAHVLHVNVDTGGLAIAGAALPFINGYRPALVVDGTRVYCLSGDVDAHGVAYAVFENDSGYEVSAIAYSSSQTVKRAPKVGAMYRGRMVLANFGSGYENALIMSDPYAPFTVPQDFLSDNGRFVRVGAPGDRIVAMIEITQTAVGSPAESALLVLCEYSAHIVTGETLTTTATPDAVAGYLGTAVFNRVSYDCGCASAETVVRTPFGVFWAGPDDVWMFTTGSVPVRIGKNIRPALAQTPASMRYLWHAAYFDGVYRLAIASDGQGPTHFDAMGDQWWLDLRDGPPQNDDQARWWGPQQYKMAHLYNTTPVQGTYFMAVNARTGENPVLYAVHSGGTDEALPALATLDASGAYDSCTADNRDVAQEIDNELAFELVTAEIDFGDPMVSKLFLGSEINLWTGEQLALSYEILLDGGRDYDSQRIVVGQKGFVAGVDAADDTRMSREFQSVNLYPDPDLRMLGKTIQLRFYSEPGWPVAADTLLYQFYMGISELVTSSRLATLPEGFYSTLSEFVDAVCAAMVDATGDGFTGNDQVTMPRPAVSISDDDLNRWTAWFDDASLDTDILRQSRKLFAALGYNTNQTKLPFISSTQAADATVRNKLAARVEIGGIFLKINTFGRRPG